jgi:hypothetical protein
MIFHLILISNPAWIQDWNNYIIMYFIPCNPYVRLPKQTSSAPKIILKKTALIWYSSLLYNTLHHTATFGSITKAHTETCIIVPMLENGVKYANMVCKFTGMQIVIHKWDTVFSEPQLSSPSKETQSCKNFNSLYYMYINKATNDVLLIFNGSFQTSLCNYCHSTSSHQGYN